MAVVNSPALDPRVEPRVGAAIFYEAARLVGIQTLAGFAVFGLYLTGAMGNQLAAILIWAFAAGVIGLRQFFWAVGQRLDYHATMPRNHFDWLPWAMAVPLVVLGFAAHLEWL